MVALGVTNQRETTVVWDRSTGRPVAPAIVWQDTRTADVLDELTDHFDPDEIRRRTGLPLATYFSGPKLRWILDHDPALRERAEAGELLFGTMDTWLVWNLTGGPDGGLHVTDVTNASRTMLMDLETLDWDDELLACMRVPARDAAGDPPIARVRRGDQPSRSPASRSTAMIGDQQASLFGQTGVRAGRRQVHLRHRQLPADEHRDRAGALSSTGWSARWPTRSRASRPSTRSRARSRSRARWCSGAATTWA